MNYSVRQSLCRHALETLPDSTSARKRILHGVLEVLRDTDPLRITAKRMLIHIASFEAEQRELPLRTDGNGDGEGSK